MGVGRIQFLEGGWTRASVPHCLLAGSLLPHLRLLPRLPECPYSGSWLLSE